MCAVKVCLEQEGILRVAYSNLNLMAFSNLHDFWRSCDARPTTEVCISPPASQAGK